MSLAIKKDNYVELEVEPRKYVKVSSKCSNMEKAIMYQIYHEFSQVISWTYDDLKTYEKSFIQHTIELEPNVKPYRQK